MMVGTSQNRGGDTQSKLHKRFGADPPLVGAGSSTRGDSFDGSDSRARTSSGADDDQESESQSLGDKEAFIRLMVRRLGIEQLPSVPSKFHLASALGNRLAESRRDAFQDYLRELTKLPFVW